MFFFRADLGDCSTFAVFLLEFRVNCLSLTEFAAVNISISQFMNATSGKAADAHRNAPESNIVALSIGGL